MKSLKEKRAAMELSLSTIVVVVLSLTMLIMGFVLVRSIMCGAISMTEGINAKSQSQIDSLFQSTGEDVTCIGAGTDPATLVAGRENNFILCSVKSTGEDKYKFSIKYNEDNSNIPKEKVREWINLGETVIKTINSNDRGVKKIYPFNIPKTAPVGKLWIDIEVRVQRKDSSTYEPLWSGELVYKVDQLGAMKGFLC